MINGLISLKIHFSNNQIKNLHASTFHVKLDPFKNDIDN